MLASLILLQAQNISLRVGIAVLILLFSLVFLFLHGFLGMRHPKYDFFAIGMFFFVLFVAFTTVFSG